MKLLTIPELAKLVGNSRQWIWMLVKQSRIKAKKVGGVFIINKEELPINIQNKIREKANAYNKDQN